jgi:hypothetical protein
MPNGTGAAAVTLRTAGASYSDIADTLGLASPRAALAVITDHLAVEVPTEDKDAMRREITASLDALLAAVWPKATDVTHIDQLPAIGRAVSLLDRKIRLHGLDAPTEVVVHTPTQSEIEAWISAQVRHTMPALQEPDIVDVESYEISEDSEVPDGGE